MLLYLFVSEQFLGINCFFFLIFSFELYDIILITAFIKPYRKAVVGVLFYWIRKAETSSENIHNKSVNSITILS